MKGYDQRVTQPDNWLHDGAEENRQFVKVIHLPIGEAWVECTNEEKERWEEEHKPEPASNGGNGGSSQGGNNGGNNGDENVFG